ALAAAPPGLATTLYAVTGAPFAVAAIQLTLACPSPPVPVTPVALPGTPRGSTGFEGAELGPVPVAFTAATVSVYAAPLVRPVTVAEVASAVAFASAPPGAAVTTNP